MSVTFQKKTECSEGVGFLPSHGHKISPGLDAVCQTLSDIEIELSDPDTLSAAVPNYKTMSIRDQNARIIQMVRDASATDGYLAGWQCLSTFAPRVSLNSFFLDDVAKCMNIYQQIRPGVQRTTIPLQMTVSHTPDQDSLNQVPPKDVRGTAWMLNDDYAVTQRAWVNAGFPLLSPCVALGWPGVQRKVISRNDLNDCDALMLLTTVDYDLDREKKYDSAFQYAIGVGRRWAAKIGTKMHSTAIVALLGLDLQINVRQIQESWVAGRSIAGSLGPDDINAHNWVAALVGDCGAYSASGYEDQKCYRQTRVGLFTAVVMGNVHDVIYDIATSNRLSSGLYAAAAGVAEFDAHRAFLTSVMDAVARRVIGLSPDEVPLFGDNALLLTGAWVLFAERYRTWERYIKYMRLLKRSDAAEARNVVNLAGRHLMLAHCDLDDVVETWRMAMTKGVEESFIHRMAVAYTPSAAPEIANIPGISQPDLCSACAVLFQQALMSFATDEIHGIPDLPANVIMCPAVSRAAAIRRVVLFASSDSCCDVCACRIGRWADVAGYMVCTALMSSDLVTSASEWLLQCYAVWAVSTWPVSVMTVLTGFDLLCNVTCEEGAMGARDVLNSWEAA